MFDAVIFVFYRGAEPITQFAEFRGKRLSIGTPGTSVRPLILQVLNASDAVDASTRLVDMDYGAGIDALIAGEIDVAVFPGQLDADYLRRALDAPDLRLMNVAQAGAIAKTIPGSSASCLWRGLISLDRDVPNADVDLLATGNSVLVRKDLHPALQYLLLKALREVHSPQGPFNRLGEFPAEQPNDLPLSPTADRFYRSGPTLWQQYTSFWLTSLLDRHRVLRHPDRRGADPRRRLRAAHLPLAGCPSHRPIAQRSGKLERELARSANKSGLAEFQARLAEIETAVRSLRVARPFEVDLHHLRIHLHMVQDEIAGLR